MTTPTKSKQMPTLDKKRVNEMWDLSNAAYPTIVESVREKFEEERRRRKELKARRPLYQRVLGAIVEK